MGLPKLSSAMSALLFEGLNFTNEQHSQNSWNLCTSNKTNYTVRHGTGTLIFSSIVYYRDKSFTICSTVNKGDIEAKRPGMV